MTPSPESLSPEPRELAKRIADVLFVNGQGQRAQRLVLTVDGPPVRDLGGWGYLAVVDQIEAVLRQKEPSR